MAVFAIAILAACGGDLGSEKCVKGPYKVVSVGTCIDKGEFFATLITCPISVETETGELLYGYTYDAVMPGQVVWKECWKEGAGTYCFETYKTNPRKMYREGGKQ